MKVKLCCLAIFLILVWFMWDSCALSEPLESLKDLTKVFSASTLFHANGDLQEGTFTASAPVPTEEDLNDYFKNPSRDLGVPDQTAFFQNVPTMIKEEEAIDSFGKQMASDIGKDSFNIKDFLPQEIHDEWFQTDLSNAKNEVDQASLIDISKFCQGVDTVGQSLKNASHDIRGNIPNPKFVVSPFLNSSYSPDTNIKSWC